MQRSREARHSNTPLQRVVYPDVKEVVASDHNFAVIGRELAVLILLRIDKDDVHVRIDARDLTSIFNVILQADPRGLADGLLQCRDRFLGGLLDGGIHFGDLFWARPSPIKMYPSQIETSEACQWRRLFRYYMRDSEEHEKECRKNPTDYI